MFQIKYLNKLYNFPVSCTETDQILEQINSILSVNDQDFILSFNNIFLSRNINYKLLEIGYSPSENLEVTKYIRKQSVFKVFGFDRYYYEQIDQFINVFTAKQHFSQQFYTVPQNIIIKYNNTKLSDSERLIIFQTTKDKPFIITVKDQYFLVNAYLNEHHFVCLKLDSTVENLKDTISMYSQKVNSIDIIYDYSFNLKEICEQHNLENESVIDLQELQELAKTVPIFEFTQFHKRLNKTFNITVTIQDDENDKTLIRTYESSQKISLYALTVFLEKDLKIDRSLFIPFDQNGDVIDLRYVLSPSKKTVLFKIFKSLSFKVDSSIQKVSYLTTIHDLRKMNNFERHHFGIIINGHFAYHNLLEKFLLIHFLNNGDLKPTTIIYQMSEEPCRLKTFTKIEPNRKVKKHFIIPKTMSIYQVAKDYMKQNVSSISIIEDSLNEIKYKISENQTIKYVLIDKNKNTHFQEINIYGQNLRIIDLINSIDKENPNFLKKILSNKYAVPKFNMKELDFWDPLSIIFSGDQKFMTIEGFEGMKEMSLLNLAMNKPTPDTISYKGKRKAKEIIHDYCQKNKMQENDLFLYADFNKLRPTDIPSFFKLKNQLLILNQEKNKKKLILQNLANFKYILKIKKENFHECADIIRGMFMLPDEKLRFQALINWNNYFLPQTFDAGSLPDYCQIFLKYDYNKLNPMTFCYNLNSKVLKVEVEEPIKLNIPVIQKEFNLWNVSANAIRLSFFSFEFPHNQSFLYYQMPETATITVSQKSSSFPIQVSIVESKAFEDYYFMDGDTIYDVINHFHIRFNSSEIYVFKNREATIQFDFEEKLEKNMKLFISSEPKEIKCEGSIGDETFCVSDFLTVKDASKFLTAQLSQKVYIFTRNDDDNSYESVPEEKRLFEFKDQLYAHKYYRKIEFNYFVFRENSQISELNTIGWLKERIVSRALFISVYDFIIQNDNKKLNDSEIIGKVLKDSMDELDIIINSGITSSSNESKNTTTTDQKPANRRKNISKYIPTVVAQDEDVKTKKNTKKSFIPRIIKLKDSDDDDDDDSDNKKKDDKFDVPEDSTKSQKNKSLPLKQKNKKKMKKKKKNKKKKKEKSSGSSDEEKTEKEEKEKEEDLITYNIQIGREEVSTLSLKNGATVNDAKIKIAKEQDDIDPNCVSILYEGKTLKKNIVLEQLKLKKDDILQVYIRNIEEILNRTAKALRIYGERDIEENYSEYEYDKDQEKEKEDKISNCIIIDLESQIDLNEYTPIERIGQGSSGEVFKIKENKTGELYAAKILYKPISAANKTEKLNLYRELNIMSKTHHPNIVKLIGFSPENFHKEEKPVIITELLLTGTLNSILENERKGLSHKLWDDTHKLINIYSIASAMSFLHSHGIIHRDLKPLNILMNDELYPKVADFGLSKMIEEQDNSLNIQSSSGIKGTPIYMAPESLTKHEYSKSSDVYAFAMIVYEIIARKVPFGAFNLYDIMMKVPQGDRPIFDELIPDCFKDLISRCWEQKPENRPSFDEIVDELKNNSEFIFGLVDEDEYLKYIEDVEEYQIKYDNKKKIVSLK